MWRSFFTERKWLLWSWGGFFFIIISLFSQTWIDVKINEWYKGFYDLLQLKLINKIPKIIGVQSEGCSPFYTAWKNNTEITETDENTIADSIAVGIPRNPIKGMDAVKKSNGFYMTVTDEEILDAIEILGKS